MHSNDALSDWDVKHFTLISEQFLRGGGWCRTVSHTQTLIERDDLWLQLDFFFLNFHHWTIHLRSIPRKSLLPWWDRLQIHCRWTTVGYGSPFFRTGLCAALPKSVGLHACCFWKLKLESTDIETVKTGEAADSCLFTGIRHVLFVNLFKHVWVHYVSVYPHYCQKCSAFTVLLGRPPPSGTDSLIRLICNDVQVWYVQK